MAISATPMDTNKSPEQLEREIDQTRGHVDDTVRALVDRLSPGELVDQALDYFRRSDVAGGARTFAYNLGSAVRDNPVPAVMVTAATRTAARAALARSSAWRSRSRSASWASRQWWAGSAAAWRSWLTLGTC